MVSRNNTLDITKFILSILVIMIHVCPIKNAAILEIVRPFLRIAVPIFFIISSYFLFSKLQNSQDQDRVVRAFCIRNIKLYLVWFIILFPITNYYSHYTKMTFVQFAKNIIFAFLFDSTFRASWYIMALVIGVLIIYYSSRVLNDKIVIIFSLILYCLCCAVTSYQNIFLNEELHKLLSFYPGRIQYSFPVALIWIYIGKYFSEINVRHNPDLQSKRQSVLFLVFCLILLLAEHLAIQNTVGIQENEEYFMLVPTCILLFKLLLSINITWKHGKEISIISTITYCVHFSLAEILNEFLIKPYMHVKGGELLLFFLTLGLCLLISLGVICLEKRGWKWLRILH